MVVSRNASETWWAGAPEQLVGREAGPSAWRRITQDDIDRFARITGDRQWLHVDAERARRESPYGTTVAHGNLTLCLIDGFRDELLGVREDVFGVNYGYERVRFPQPVPAGARVRARVKVVSAEAQENGWVRVVQHFTVEIEGAPKPACVADSVVLVRRAAPETTIGSTPAKRR